MKLTCLTQLVLASGFCFTNFCQSAIDFSTRAEPASEDYFSLETPASEDYFELLARNACFSTVNCLSIFCDSFFERAAFPYGNCFMSNLRSLNDSMNKLTESNRHAILQLVEGAYLSGDDLKLSLAGKLAFCAFRKQLRAHYTHQLIEDAKEFVKQLQEQEELLQRQIGKYSDEAYKLYVKELNNQISRKEQGVVRVWFAIMMLAFYKTPFGAPLKTGLLTYEFVKWWNS